VLGPPPSITEDIQRLQLNAKEEKERKRERRKSIRPTNKGKERKLTRSTVKTK
jgi:hypothetical protein